MSIYSGKCDLYDHIAGQGGWFDKNGNPVKFGDPDVGVYYSDELKDFESFKKKSGGVIYQSYKVTLDSYNQNFVKDHCKGLEIIEHTTTKQDKRVKTGVKNYTYYTYKYYGEEYSLAELNKRGLFIEVEIKFDTLLDLIPYYPYIVAVAVCDKDKEHVVVSRESYVDQKFKDNLRYGWISGLDYKKDLQKHYLKVCQEYFLKDLDKRTNIINIKDLVACENDDGYILKVDNIIDYMHEINFIWTDGKRHEYWTSPKMIDEHTIKLSKADVEDFLADDIKNSKVLIKYVERMLE